MKPIAVFLDGFAFHRDRVGKDMAQRMAIVHSNKYRVWSLSWQDVENKFKPQNDYFMDFLEPDRFPSGFSSDDAVARWTEDLEIMAPEDIVEKMMDTECPCFYGDFRPKGQDGRLFLQQAAVIEHQSMTPPGMPYGAKICCLLNDEKEDKEDPTFRSVWNGFLRLYNYFQFLPCTYFITADGAAHKAYDGLKLYDPVFSGTDEEMPEGEPQGQADRDIWNEAKVYTQEIYHDLLDRLRAALWPVPELGYELINGGGEIVASAEMAWGDLKLAFLTDVELAGEHWFEEAGWKTISIQDVVTDPGSYMDIKDNNGE